MTKKITLRSTTEWRRRKKLQCFFSVHTNDTNIDNAIDATTVSIVTDLANVSMQPPANLRLQIFFKGCYFCLRSFAALRAQIKLTGDRMARSELVDLMKSVRPKRC